MPKVYIIGGGIAGHVAAWACSKLDYEIILLEKEKQPFYYSSSRNSAIAKSYEADPYLSFLVKKSLWLMLNEPNLKSRKLIETNGLFIIPKEYDYYENDFLLQYPEATSLKSLDETFKLPATKQNKQGKFIPHNGFFYLNNIFNFLKNNTRSVSYKYLNKVIKFNIEDECIRKIIIHNKNNKEETLNINKNDIIINSKGSWANEIFKKKHLHYPPLKYYKRHMFYFHNPNQLLNRQPIFWDENHNIYFRTYYNLILASHCDEKQTLYNDYSIDNNILNEFSSHVQHHYPFLLDLKIFKITSCIRTLTLDERPIIGFDTYIKNFFWNVGWGGKGISLSFGLVDEILHLLKNTKEKDDFKNPFAPSRFT